MNCYRYYEYMCYAHAYIFDTVINSGDIFVHYVHSVCHNKGKYYFMDSF